MLLVLFGLVTTLGINGSSTGIYHKMLNGRAVEDPGLIYGTPKSIRSDEYLIFSPRVALQAQTGYPAFNEHIGSGRELIITPEAPIKDWVGFFRPHTLGYFLLPFTNGFAFSWWFGLFALLISSYFFFLRILDNSRTLSVLFSVSLALSPFILWWFQIGLLLSLAYFFVAGILMMRLLNHEKLWFIKSQRLSDFLHTAALVYIGASLGLLLYAPFLIPVTIVLVVFMTGYIIDGLKSKELQLKRVKNSALMMALALLGVVVIGVIFYFDRREMIQVVANSVYPGDRQVASGDLPFSPLYRFFDSFLMPLLPKPPTGSFYANQSEASNFILLLPFLLVPGILIQIYDYRKNRRISWTFTFIQALAVLFILRITTPLANGFFKLLLLNRVPNNRLMIGVGLLGFLQLIYLIKQIQKIKIPKRQWSIIVGIFSLLTLFWLLIFSKYFFSKYLVFNYSYLVVGTLAVFFTAIIAAFLSKKVRLGATLLLTFTVGSSFYILPLQKGLPFFEDSQIVNRIRQVSGPSESWAVVDNFTFESLPLLAGRHLINGHQPYTDFDFWHQLDKDGLYENIYNRQAHALFITNESKPNEFFPARFASIERDMELVQGNVFKVKFECSEFFYENVDFVLTTQQLSLTCLTPVDRVSYPKATFYIYKLTR